MRAASSVSDEPGGGRGERDGTDAPMLLRAPGAVNFNHPRPGWLFEWVVTRIGRGAKKGVATVLWDSGTSGTSRGNCSEIYNGWSTEVANAGRQGAAGGS